MSNIGINTSTFRITSKYLDILNDFIVKAKINPEITEARQEQLIEFLSKLTDVNNTEPQFQMLSSIIERELRNSHKRPEIFFTSLIEDIQNKDTETVIPKIELITEALDVENSEILAKIIGD
ncbi:hypothetical protein QWZ08_19515 [Ferruginibacter paludis]|uniref:hypothetical protein n=1 Tax=Ferruginibacter paludis TaxID=1310417 RepID=UPI0025B3F4A3|nr:hypothetical protein [Ferruginibacter paludis]MDN3657850.1 hypothetical protein [Ferruginibacter paludis]